MDCVSIRMFLAQAGTFGYIIQMADTDRPRVGLVGDRRPASFGAWVEVDLSFAWTHYIEAISRAGGAPLIVPLDECFASAPELALDVVDALVLTGGRDLDAATHGAEPRPENEPGDPLRDRVELAIATLGLERDLPILGVCRGMQLLNVCLGGGIAQHLADPEGVHRAAPGTFVAHEIEPVAGSRLASILGPAASSVRSHHHQALEPLAAEMTVTARSPDGLVEAVEIDGKSFCLGVLWHPEEDLDSGGLSLYEALIEAAGARRRTQVAA